MAPRNQEHPRTAATNKKVLLTVNFFINKVQLGHKIYVFSYFTLLYTQRDRCAVKQSTQGISLNLAVHGRNMA
jgi:hypothetical protein